MSTATALGLVTRVGELYCSVCATDLELVGEAVHGPPHSEESCERCGRVLAVAHRGYVCGANYCDDPACVGEHPERL